MSLLPIQIVEKLAEDKLTNCAVVLLAGSAAKLQHNTCSDLDVVVFSYEIERPYRQVIRYEGWPVELFAFPAKGCSELFELNAERGLPTLMRMIAEGHVIADNGLAADIKREAEQYLEAGPKQWTLDQMNQVRFQITENVVDLEDSSSSEEALFIALHLFTLSCHFWLRVNGKWIGEGKWLKRELEQENPLLYRKGIESMQRLFHSGSVQEITDWADEIIAPYGGRLYEGFASEAHI